MLEALGQIIAAVLGALLLLAVGVAIATVPAWLIWNWVMPTVFGLPQLTWLQTAALLFLSGCFFKSSGGVSRS